MYINGTGAISPQHTDAGDFPFRMTTTNEVLLSCREPDYKEHIPPRTSRRMSRVIKMGVATALMALKDADIGQPDAIVTGSGFGCMSDTEKFLGSIMENNEKFLNPAPFIYSTHNTISSQIALLLKCTGYNQTFVHGPFSFESALLDALMLLQENTFNSVLVGGIDEMTANLFEITRRFGLWKRKPLPNQDLFSSDSKGTLAGEGASFFLLHREKNRRSQARITDVETHFGVKTDDEIASWIDRFLENNGLKPDDLDLCFLGKNGDNRFDRIYTALQAGILKQCPIGYYKHLCGEYLTSSAFAVWLAANILKTQRIPAGIMATDRSPSSLQSVLIFNRYRTEYQSLVLLQAC